MPTVVEDTMQYVPLEKLLGALMLNDQYCKIMTNISAGTPVETFESNEVVKHYFHSNSYKQHPFFQKHSNEKIYVILDLLETTFYDEHFHAYVIKHPDQKSYICVRLCFAK